MGKKQEIKDAYIAVVIDKSGSMESKRSDAIGGFNTFKAEQAALPARTVMTVIQFDTSYYIQHVGAEIADVPDLNAMTYSPSGLTALNDSFMRAIGETDEWVTANPKFKGQVFVAVITDGEENSSRETTTDQIKQAVADHEAQGWTFFFIGVGLEAFEQGRSYGVTDTISSADTGAGTVATYAATSSGVTHTRSGGAQGQSLVNYAMTDSNLSASPEDEKKKRKVKS